jgi:D-threonate/D-erythronate kinase
MKFAIIADDLTGANDACIGLTRAGHRSAVTFYDADLETQTLDAISVDTDSRTAPANQARTRVLEAMNRHQGAQFVYKKFDSTLRGNIAVELQAALESSGRNRAIIAPALPMYGRTTRNGTQLLDRVALHQTPFARDPRNPVTQAHIPSLLAPVTGHDAAVLSVEALRDGQAWKLAQRHPWTVVDIETEDDLRLLVQSVPDPHEVLWAGSTGLIRSIGEVFPGQANAAHARFVASNRVLTVVGSINALSRTQLERLCAVGVMGVPFDPTGQDALAKAVSAASMALSAGSNVALFSTAPATTTTDLDAARVAQQLAEVVARLVGAGLVDALVLTGGDTAIHVARAVGANGVLLEREVEPGIPLGRFTGKVSFPVVTKAGGFGSNDALVHALYALTEEKS